MRTMFIKISNFEDITRMVHLASSTVEGRVTFKRDIYVVDGKSLMGVLSLALSGGVYVEYPETATQYEEYLLQFKG